LIQCEPVVLGCNTCWSDRNIVHKEGDSSSVAGAGQHHNKTIGVGSGADTDHVKVVISLGQIV